MKTLSVVLAMAMICLNASAQEPKKPDTIRIGNIIIIKQAGKKDKNKNTDSTSEARTNGKKSHSLVKTNWGIIDLGFSNYSDMTNYGNTGSYLVNNPATGVPAISGNDLKLRAGKSINVNIWFFMQRLNIIKRNVSLKYGLGLELNNYRYKSTISYKEGGVLPYTAGQINAPFIFRDTVAFSKNKLAADYLTIPVMLNFSTNPSGHHKPFQISIGVSGGYLYSQRNKQKSNVRGKDKNKGDYDLERFKFSYISELGLGPVRLYGSYSPNSIYERELDIRPYTFGIRFSNL